MRPRASLAIGGGMVLLVISIGVAVFIDRGTPDATGARSIPTTVTPEKDARPSTTVTRTTVTRTTVKPTGTGPGTATTPPGEVRRATLTSPSGASYRYRARGHTITVDRPDTVPDLDVREVFWRAERQPTVNQQQCMTWETLAAPGAGALRQPGLALRIASDGRGGTRAITVNQNIWASADWLIWVTLWDSTDVEHPHSEVTGFELADVIPADQRNHRGPRPVTEPPWHVCARVIANHISVMLWTDAQDRPSWGDRDRVIEATLPPGWDYSGVSGGYLGHLGSGETAEFTDSIG